MKAIVELLILTCSKSPTIERVFRITEELHKGILLDISREQMPSTRNKTKTSEEKVLPSCITSGVMSLMQTCIIWKSFTMPQISKITEN